MSHFKIEQPQEPESDALREKLITKRRYVELAAGLVILIAGIALIISKTAKLTLPEPLGALFAGFMIIIFCIIFIMLAGLAKYDLKPKDEYEMVRFSNAKVKSYDLLVPVLLVMAIWSDKVEKISWSGVLLVILGAARIYEFVQIRKQP